MNKKVIIQMPLNTYIGGKKNSENETNEEWIKYRIMLFTGYCLKSLKAQSNQNFTALIKCREETIPFIKKEMGELPDNVLIVGVVEYEQKIKDLIKGHENLYLVRVDSDDMWKKDFIEWLHNYTPKPETELLLNQYCYNYDIYEDRLAFYFLISPQSYVLLYKVSEYLEGKRYSLPGGHRSAIIKIHEIIPGANYLDTIHKVNICSHFLGHGGFKEWREIKEEGEKRSILEEFGLYGKEYIHEKESV
jgi:hypothetical protein